MLETEWVKSPKDQRQLRDEFAMAALTGIIAGQIDFNTFSEAAIEAYNYADAMIEARQQ